MKTLYELCANFFDMAEMPEEYKNPVDDKRCFQVALQHFLETGRKEDAFVVYFCFSEIFKLFGQGYDNTKKLLEMLSDHEYHSGELLTKHRDHYSHSVYVFALGLAIYNNDPSFRQSYQKFYGLSQREAAYNFWRFWGITSLFHDIGYPFQLAHEQIKTYSETLWGEDNQTSPFVSFGNMKKFIALNDNIKTQLKDLFPDCGEIETINDLLSYGLKARCGYDPIKTSALLYKRVVKQRYFMDHGYFSAAVLAAQIFALPNLKLTQQHLDALTAILLHNNLNKHDMPNAHLIDLDEHPLAYLLMLCDELQCWDRLAYGKVSKRAPLAWQVELNISAGNVIIKYIYDSFVIKSFGNPYDAHSHSNAEIVENKNYTEMRDGTFVEKIFGTRVVLGESGALKKAAEGKKTYPGYITPKIKLVVRTQEVKKQKRTRLYASDDSFIELCDLAKAIHVSYTDHCLTMSCDHINQVFGDLPLEFKVSNIEQAKSYAYKLELINCFYSSKELDYPVVENFDDVCSDITDTLGFLCREEHARWVKEKLAMGWKYGTDYTTTEERNKKKINRSIVPYECLSEEDKSKDVLMINNIFTLLKKFNSNIKVYNYRAGRLPTLEIAGTGHRFYKDDDNALKAEVKAILSKYQQTHNVIVRTCFAYGADQLIAECAVELGIPIKADIPLPYEQYIADVKQDALQNGHPFGEKEELRMRHLLAQTVVCRVVPDPKYKYVEANRYIVNKSDVLIALWDGKELDLYDKNDGPINRGGTYDCIKTAEAKGMRRGSEIIIVDCYR